MRTLFKLSLTHGRPFHAPNESCGHPAQGLWCRSLLDSHLRRSIAFVSPLSVGKGEPSPSFAHLKLNKSKRMTAWVVFDKDVASAELVKDFVAGLLELLHSLLT